MPMRSAGRALVIAVACLSVGMVHGQQAPTTEPEVPEMSPDATVRRLVEPETEALREATDALRRHLQEMREVMVRFNVGSDDEDKQ